MAEIRPFRGVRYNQRLFKDLSSMVCAPSDIITPTKQRELYHRSECNFVRLDASLGLAEDTCEDSRWQRAAITMKDWLNKGILQIDEVPAIYLHDYSFTYLGKEYVRRSITAIVRLERWDRMIVRRHEKILPELKKSRLIQIRAMKADTSPLLVFFKDQEERISSLLSTLKLGKPIISLDCNTEGRHKVWSITEPEFIDRIRTSLAEEPFYIADGHHRYASALTYQAERLASCPSTSMDDAFNFVMMTLTPTSDPGLIVRPFHRVVRGIPESILRGLPTELKTFFNVEEWPLDMPGVWQKADNLLINGDPSNPDEVAMIIFGLASDKLVVLRVRNFTIIGRAMPDTQSEECKRLDVSIADQIIIERLLRITDSKKEKLLDFSIDRQDAVRKVTENKYQLALLLRATKPEQIITIADRGETMPEKSTRFYPKPPTGFVFYQLE
ncbi:DUF1015 domain-containing protein [Chloroflexota bacterium]